MASAWDGSAGPAGNPHGRAGTAQRKAGPGPGQDKGCFCKVRGKRRLGCVSGHSAVRVGMGNVCSGHNTPCPALTGMVPRPRAGTSSAPRVPAGTSVARLAAALTPRRGQVSHSRLSVPCVRALQGPVTSTPSHRDRKGEQPPLTLEGRKGPELTCAP